MYTKLQSTVHVKPACRPLLGHISKTES